MNVPFLDLKAQYLSIKDEVDSAIQSVINSTSFIRGKYVEKFEQNFARALGVKYCIGVANGTDALFIALKSLGIGEGDEVITQANSFIATSEAISQCGARVVFADCMPFTAGIDVTDVRKKITDRTKAIIPVHLYGNPAPMDDLLKLAADNGLFIIEDAAQAHLAMYKGKTAGTFGHLATFSFYPGKNLGAYGDAGAIVTQDESLARYVRMYSNHGRSDKYNHLFEGINSRMDEIQAAVLDVKLKYLAKWTALRIEKANYYHELLADMDEIVPIKPVEGGKHVYHLFVVRVKEREKLRKHLSTKGIQTGVHYPVALPFLKAYDYLKYKAEDFPVASLMQDEVLSLPLYPEMNEEMIHYVVDEIKNFYAKTK